LLTANPYESAIAMYGSPSPGNAVIVKVVPSPATSCCALRSAKVTWASASPEPMSFIASS
jgi:hypothetical protein